MCPRCKGQEVLYWLRHTGMINGRLIPTSTHEPIMTAIVCNKCGYLIYDEKWGWASDVTEKIRQFTELFKQHGTGTEAALFDFLTEMGIPAPYLKGGAYYIQEEGNE